jgi:hypothetical protein
MTSQDTDSLLLNETSSAVDYSTSYCLTPMDGYPVVTYTHKNIRLQYNHALYAKKHSNSKV